MFRYLFLIVCALLFCRVSGLAQADSLSTETVLAVSDGSGCVYTVNRENILCKIDTTLTVVASVNLSPYGFGSSVECRGNNEVIVYCYGTGRLLVFDNFLKEKNQFDLSTLLRTKPNLVCISSYGWWCFDETNSSLSKYNGNFSLLYTFPQLLREFSGAVKMAEADEKFLVFERGDHAIIPLYAGDDAASVNARPVSCQQSPALNYRTVWYYTEAHDSLQIVNVRSGAVQYKALHPDARKAVCLLKSNTVFYIIRENAVFLRHVPFLLTP